MPVNAISRAAGSAVCSHQGSNFTRLHLIHAAHTARASAASMATISCHVTTSRLVRMSLTMARSMAMGVSDTPLV